MYPDDSTLNYENEDTVAFFSLPYEAFNNWSAHQINIWGRVFATVEHAFQYAKFQKSAPAVAEEIAAAHSPWAAYKIAKANRSMAASDWADRKVGIMTELIRAKVSQNEDVRERLLHTGTKRIAENSPWDSFWGLGPDGNGKNTLGEIYMQIRSEI